MADIDTKLIGQIISSIPYDQAFGAPLSAAIDAQSKAAESALNFILKVGFEKDKDGLQKTRYAEFEFDETKNDGQKQTRRLKIPLILLINIPQLEITEGVISFDLEISQNASVSDKIDAGGEVGGNVGWGPFSLSFKAKASYSRESTRKTDTRAKQHVEMTVKQSQPPEALNVMMEIMRDAALGSASGKSLQDKTHYIPSPNTDDTADTVPETDATDDKVPETDKVD